MAANKDQMAANGNQMAVNEDQMAANEKRPSEENPFNEFMCEPQTKRPHVETQNCVLAEFDGWDGDELPPSEDFMQPKIPVFWKNGSLSDNKEKDARASASYFRHTNWANSECRGLFNREQNISIVLNDQDIIIGKSDSFNKGETARRVGNMRYVNMIKLATEAFNKFGYQQSEDFRHTTMKRILFKIFFHTRVTKKHSDYKLTDGVEFDISRFNVSRFVKEVPDGINNSQKVWVEMSASDIMSLSCSKIALIRNRKIKGVRRKKT